jgi:serine/threonine-protein kinase
MQSIPVQSWNFEHESVIRIGRSTDNHVILYSAVVSRHHVEIRKSDTGWDIVNLGANGTYLDGRRITQVPVEDGVVIRLARSGPNVQIHLGAKSLEATRATAGDSTLGQPRTIPPAPTSSFVHQTTVQAEDEGVPHIHADTSTGIELSECCPQYVNSAQLFCLVCGKPLQTIGQIAPYWLVKELDQDEVSVSYLGWNQGKTVVLKTPLPSWMGHPEAVALFDQEARHLLHLHHPSLPRFTEVLLDQGQPYLVMEPAYGRSLEQIVATDGPLPTTLAIARILEICDALHYLHSQTPAIVHQAIKPAYLIQRATPNAPLLLTGFTPAKSLTPVQSNTTYAAPEQLQAQITPASDLYALGPTLVYLLTGKPPETFYAQREQGFRFYAEYVPGLTAELVAIIRKLTHPQPSERYASVQDLVTALQQIETPTLQA